MDRLGPAGEIHVVGDLPGDRLADRDHGRVVRSDPRPMTLAATHRGEKPATGESQDGRTAGHRGLAGDDFWAGPRSSTHARSISSTNGRFLHPFQALLICGSP